jgi:hypothetical protein
VYIISKVRSQKEVAKQLESRFFLLFCLVIEGSRSGSGSIILTDGSGSGSRRPNNMWIRWIRIRNAGYNGLRIEKVTVKRLQFNNKNRTETL